MNGFDLSFFVSLQPGRLVGSAINLTIVCLVLSAFRQLFAQSRRVSAEQATIEKLRELVAEIAGALETAAGVAAALESASGTESMVGDRLTKYSTAEQRRATLNREAISAVDVEKLRASLTWSQFVAGAVVLLGLAGTLYGLSVAVIGLAETLSGSGPFSELMRAGLREALSGMKTAFSTTLVGVVGTLMVGAAMARVRRGQSELMISLESFTTDYLDSQPGSDSDAALKTAAERLTQLTGQWSDLRERVGIDLGRILQTVDSSMEGLTKQITEEWSGLRDTVAASLEQILESVDKSNETLLKRFDATHQMAADLIGTVDSETGSLADHARSLNEAGSRILEAAAETRNSLPELERTLTSAADRQSAQLREIIEQHSRSMSEQIKDQAVTTGELTAGVKETAASVESIAANLGAFAEAADEYRAIWQSIMQSVQAATTDVGERLSLVQRAVEESLARVSMASATSQERVADALRDYERSLLETLQSLDVEKRRVADKSNELLEGVQATLKESLRELAGRGDVLQKSTIDTIRRSFRELEKEIRGLTRAMDDGARRPGGGASRGRAPTTIDLDELKSRLGKGSPEPGSSNALATDQDAADDEDRPERES